MAVFSATLAIFASLGLGRFALGVLLPAMGDALSLSYSEMGIISTGNFCGYLVAVIASPRLIKFYAERSVVLLGLICVVTGMGMISQGESFAWVLAWYVLVGFGSGAANIAITVLIAQWFENSHRGRAFGYITTGSSLGIVLSGWLIPLINASSAETGWRLSWAALSGIAFIVILMVSLLLRNKPEDLGLAKLGDKPSESPSSPKTSNFRPASPNTLFLKLGALYLLYGATYMIYGTFIVNTLVQDRGFSEIVAGQFWSWVGVLSLLSGPLFGALLDRSGPRLCFLAVFAIHASAYLLVALHLGDWSLYLSVILFGLAAWGVPAIMSATIPNYAEPAKLGATVSMVTLYSAVGQIIGPAAGGIMADGFGSFDSSFWLAGILSVMAVIVTMSLPKGGGR